MAEYLDLIKKGVVLFDGAMGTQLYENGVFVNRCFEEICLTSPDLVKKIHKEMIEAGAMVITTNSFGANPLKLKEYGLMDKTQLINKKAVEIAKAAVKESGKEVLIAGSVGPIGQRIEPFGKLTQREAGEAFSIQIKSLIDAGVDIIILETFSNIDELVLAAEISKKVNSSIPVQAQFSLRLNKNEDDCESAVSAAVRLDNCEFVDVAGTNCTIGPAYMLDVLLAVQDKIQKPFAVMPNAGFPKEVDGRQIYMTSPDYFAEYAMRFLEGGASVIGGCCGTGPEHIARMAKSILNVDKGHRAASFVEVLDKTIEKKPLVLEKKSGLGKMLAEGKWITSVELVPPIGVDLTDIIEKSRALKYAGVNCINVPDGPRASSRISALITAIEIQNKAGIEAIPHICSRDRNLIGIQSDLLACEAVGLKNILFITGDPPKVGNYPNVTGVFDVDAVGMLSLAKRLNHGIDIGGNSINGQTSLVLGAGANPVSPFLEKEIEKCFMKAQNGAEYFITQPVFDAQKLIIFLERIKDCRVPVIAGVWPLASYRNALFMQNEVPGVSIPESVMKRMEACDTKEAAMDEGIAIAKEIIEEIRPYLAGIQISPPFGRLETAIKMLK